MQHITSAFGFTTPASEISKHMQSKTQVLGRDTKRCKPIEIRHLRLNLKRYGRDMGGTWEGQVFHKPIHSNDLQLIGRDGSDFTY